jgi:peptidoglycan-associated lipoprotein
MEAAKPAPAPIVAPKPTALAPHLDPNSSLMRARSVYFDFDRDTLRDDARPVVETHGKYLGGAADVKAVVEGNADERGSSEYNLALGQRRAEVVVKSLKVMGAKDGQLEAVSYGKERPVANGHDEGAWSQNRRADIRYK